mmetsp:Transcript_19973/g.43497  ORF Transcript_19973/g.43497 Transcript_19973/m.43497 type:complete len:753 (-) Transcript_19973:506-2764(-)
MMLRSLTSLHRHAALLTVACALVIAGVASQDNLQRVHLRTTTIELTPQSNLPQCMECASAPATAAAGVSLPNTGIQNSAFWSDLTGKDLFIVGYKDASRLDYLLSTLPTKGITVGSYIPDHALLVAAEVSNMEAAMADLDVTAVPYEPSYKVAPEWQPLLAAVQAQQQQQAAGAGSGGQRSLLQEADVAASPELKGFVVVGEDGVGRITLRVSFPLGLVMGQQQQQQQDLPRAAAEDWRAPLEALLAPSGTSCTPTLTPNSLSLDVLVCAQDAGTALSWLSRQPLSHFVAPRAVLRPSNINAGISMQCGRVEAGVGDDPTNTTYHPFWAAGLDGTGQIVGVGDTGLKVDSCFFHDPSVPLDPSQAVADIPQLPAVRRIRPQGHRKVVQYIVFQSFGDENGHGTHVSGSVLGSPLLTDIPGGPGPPPITKPLALDSVARGTGVAPGAKLAFFDIFNGNRQGALTPPTDLKKYYEVQYASGARIQSDSWGYDTPYSLYVQDCADIDAFAWRNPDFLPLMAAGNTGPSSLASGASTVQPPATAKNIISVGAAVNFVPPQQADSVLLSASVISSTTGQLLTSFSFWSSVAPDFGTFAPVAGRVLEVVVAQPPLLCGPPTNAAEMRGAAVLIMRGTCDFANKVAYAAAAGAAATSGSAFALPAAPGLMAGRCTVSTVPVPPTGPRVMAADPGALLLALNRLKPLPVPAPAAAAAAASPCCCCCRSSCCCTLLSCASSLPSAAVPERSVSLARSQELL